MQRGNNRQARGDHGGRGRGSNRSRGSRGNFSSPSYAGNSPRVPTTTQVISGAYVSIVLKVDQGTEREVQGTVADILTFGNHPRGIKVRLRDGRVGRVQRMVSQEAADAGSRGLSNLGRNGEVVGEGEVRTIASERFVGSGRSDIGSRYRDVRREEGGGGIPPTGYDLEALLPPGHPLLREDTRSDRGIFTSDSYGQALQASKTSICPVCNEFEGDEVAVAHHVSSHFD